jgi:hypothetical protein
MADFSRYTNYKNDASVSGVIFGAGSTVLEVELNEMQEIQKHTMREFIKNIVGNGITDISKIVYNDGFIEILEGCYIIHEGYLIKTDGTMRVKPNIDAGETVCLQIWEEDITSDDVLYKHGNVLNTATIQNWFKDDRADNVTTKRKVIRYKLMTAVFTSDYDATKQINVTYNGHTVSAYRVPIAKVNKSGVVTKLIDEIGYDIDNMSDVYGVEIDFDTGIFTRLAGSVGKYGGADHDTIDIFNRRRCNVTDDGYVTAYYGDDNYAEGGKTPTTIAMKDGTILPAGTRVQVMVEQPKFYYKMIPLKLEPIADVAGEYHIRKARYYISATQKEGFKIHPAFVVNGVIKDKIYIGAYEAGVYDTDSQSYISGDDADVTITTTDKLSSVAHIGNNNECKPYKTMGYNRNDFRTMANNIGIGWGLKTFTVASMDQLLFLIEYAQFSAQKTIGIGNTNNKGLIPVGTTNKCGNKTNISTYGGTNSSITYRGEENIYGNYTEFIDGINMKKRQLSWSNDLNYFSDNGALENIYCSSLPSTSGIITAFVYKVGSPDDWAFVPSEINTDGFIIDDGYNYTSNAEWKPVEYGGMHKDTNKAGLFYLGYRGSIGTRETTARLLYIPDVQ